MSVTLAHLGLDYLSILPFWEELKFFFTAQTICIITCKPSGFDIFAFLIIQQFLIGLTSKLSMADEIEFYFLIKILMTVKY